LRYNEGRERVQDAWRAVIPAAISITLILQLWAPTWFVAGWVTLYLVITGTFSTLTLWRPAPSVEQLWSIATAALFSSIPISTVLWSNQTEHYWASMTISVLFIAFEMSALPFVRIGEWRIGVLMVGATMTICGILTINPIVALTTMPLVLAMVHAADRIRKLKLDLERHLFEAQLTIRHDPLTGLLNRRGLTNAVVELAGEDITVALIDVDRFKIINDTHGHQVGDQVLIALAMELRERFGTKFFLARLGGDEFVALAQGRISLSAKIAAPMSLQTEVHEQPFVITCGVSVGVSYGRNTDSAQRLLSEAGFAMRESKRTGSTLSRFGQELADRLDRTLHVAAVASGTSDQGVFVPIAQTIVADDRIVGCELLIRLQRPDGELVTPDQFLPIAVEAGLMPTINELMLEHAVRFAARFNNRPAAPFVSVNISAPYLGEPGFYPLVKTLLEEHRVLPERLMIEITETEEFGGYTSWEATATELRALGVNLAIDDFGTGYSSIERLQHLPISHLKFDRSLVQSVTGPFGEIVKGVARFANAVNVGIIAEGIETLDECESMRAFHVSMFQGFLFHRPEPLDQVEVLVIEDRFRHESESIQENSD